MKHLTIIASCIILISSYSFTAEYNATFINNLPQDNLEIFSIKGHPCTVTKRNCLVGPQKKQPIPIDVDESKTQGMFVMTTTTIKSDYMFKIKTPFPQTITVRKSITKGPDYVDVLYDGKLYATMANKPRNITKK